MRHILVIIALFFLLLLGVVAFVLTRTAQPSPKPQPTTDAPPVPQPSFPPPAQPIQPKYLLRPTRGPQPGRVDSYVLPPVDTAAQAARLAAFLGLDAIPTTFVGSRGTFTTWSSGNKTLSVGGAPAEVSYTSGLVQTGVIQISEQELVSRALSFLQSLDIVHKNLSLEPMQPLYFAPSGNLPNELDGAPGATAVQINFRYHLGSLPFFMRLPDIPGASVLLNAEGAVVSFSAYWFPVLEKAPGEVAVSPPEPVIARLTRGEGALLALVSDEDKNNEELPYYQVNTSSIVATSFGYYLASGETRLSPVYVFFGRGEDERSGKSVNTTTVVSALP